MYTHTYGTTYYKLTTLILGTSYLIRLRRKRLKYGYTIHSHKGIFKKKVTTSHLRHYTRY